MGTVQINLLREEVPEKKTPTVLLLIELLSTEEDHPDKLLHPWREYLIT